MTRALLFSVAVAFCLSNTAVCVAATYSILGVVTAYDTVNYQLVDGPSNNGVPSAQVNWTEPQDPLIYQLDLYLAVDDFVSGQRGFGNITFNINPANLDNSTVPGWQADNPQVDTNGAQSGGMMPQWDENDDLGNPSDLQNIVVGIAVIADPDPSDPRPYLGQTSAVLMGSVFLDYPGSNGSASVSVVAGQASYADDDGLLQQDSAAVLDNFAFNITSTSPLPGDTNNDGVVDLRDLNDVKDYFGTDGSLGGDADANGVVNLTDLNLVKNNFGNTAFGFSTAVPEPASAMLLCIGAMGMLARRS
jgi:PEP-CTERM motif